MTDSLEITDRTDFTDSTHCSSSPDALGSRPDDCPL